MLHLAIASLVIDFTPQGVHHPSIVASYIYVQNNRRGWEVASCSLGARPWAGDRRVSAPDRAAGSGTKIQRPSVGEYLGHCSGEAGTWCWHVHNR